MGTKKLLLLILLFFNLNSFSQKYGNEWINYNQKYYRFPIVQNGIYKIDFNALSNSGIPVNALNSDNFQLFGKEKELPLHIEDGGDNKIDNGDYILFYAEKNDGWLDSTLYNNSTDIGNPAYSLFNDTLNYFLTWNNSSNNLRFTIETDQNFNNYLPTNFILKKVENYFTNKYNEGNRTDDESSSFYQPGEGWGSNQYSIGSVVNLSLNTPYTYLGSEAPSPEFNGISVTRSNANYTLNGNHHTKWQIGSNNYTLHDEITIGWRQIFSDTTFPISELNSGSTPIKYLIVNDQGATTDFQAINYYSVTYPKQTNLENLASNTFDIVNSSIQNKIRLDFSNVNYANPIIFVLGDTPRKIDLTNNNGFYSTLIPNSFNNKNQKVVYQNLNTVSSISNLKPINQNGLFTDYTSFNPEEALLMIYNSKMDSASLDYATYRNSVSGGYHNVILANVDELYYQFGGGVNKHINGIRRFAHYFYKKSTKKPIALFLLGKALYTNDLNTTSTLQVSRQNSTYYAQNLIPAFGQPSSDIAITSNLEGSNWAPIIPTGRISVSTNTDLRNYLDKVIAFEAQQDTVHSQNISALDWQKQILHFGGGQDANEQAVFQGTLNQMETTIEDANYAGNVHRVYKSNTQPLDLTILTNVSKRIQEGVSIMTFFSHYAPTNSGFEINLDNPSTWNNTNKYPVVIGNSCYNGDIYNTISSTSERFVNAKNSGSIAFIASVYKGVSNTLSFYSTNLYQQISKETYGKTIGQQMKSTIEYINSVSNSLGMECTSAQMTLNGDPMIHINSYPKPEIELKTENVSFNPPVFDLNTPFIEMDLILTNLGKAITDTFNLEVKRDFPLSNDDSTYLFKVNGLNYKDTLKLLFPLQANIASGVNTFTISADIPNFINEQFDDNFNNQITKSLFINIDGILPVLPHDFAIVPNNDVTIKASTINPIAPQNTYRFEIDTSNSFNSPEFRYAQVSGLGGVKEVKSSEWKNSIGITNPLICSDSTVYFWRVAIDEPNPIWKQQSFQYINGKEGWGQAHFYQFTKNEFNGVVLDSTNRTKLFNPSLKKLRCDNQTYFSYDIAYYIDNQQQDYGICTMTPSIHAVIIDPYTLKPWRTYNCSSPTPGCGCTPINPDHQFGNANNGCGSCRTRADYFFIYRQNNATQLAAFQDLVTNKVPNGYYLLIYTPLTTQFSNWNNLAPTLYNTFQQLGSDSIVPGRPEQPFIFFCKKGDKSSVKELFSSGKSNFNLETNLVGFDYKGSETSTMIGPAENWNNVYWQQRPFENINNSADSTNLTIKGFDIFGAEQISIDTLLTKKDSILNLNSQIPANLYPYIKLEANYVDKTQFTPAQLKRWQVLYNPLPEAALDDSIPYTWLPNKDTLNEGERIKFAINVKNIYKLPMDSLLINYWIEDEYHNKHFINYSRQDSLRVNQSFRDTIEFSTVGLPGSNIFWMEVNPYINGSLYITDQPEQKHFNNLLQKPFYITREEVNPILDVTFDNKHLLNGDIVSPRSEILITLKDDNPYLVMDSDSDTSLFAIYLTDPKGIQKRIYFSDNQGNSIMTWTPANAQNKRFKINYPANFAFDGKYTLLVQGTDRSGNLSGDIEYKINFEVVHASTLTYLMNYPNPFSTSTKFVFTLTGSEIPDKILIQIMNVTGKVVREITQDELGPISIGRNVTQFSWDGKDNFGDQLANGVYLYTVKAQINGEDIEHRSSESDVYFKKEFGKMYLFR